MSLFDDLSKQSLEETSDRFILEKYNLSHSKNSLIPKSAAIAASPKSWSWYRSKPVTVGVFREEESVFKSIFKTFLSMGLTEQRSHDVFIDTIRNMGLPILIYNHKRYYIINRKNKKKLIETIKNHE